jgi:hypothetical protein
MRTQKALGGPSSRCYDLIRLSKRTDGSANAWIGADCRIGALSVRLKLPKKLSSRFCADAGATSVTEIRQRQRLPTCANSYFCHSCASRTLCSRRRWWATGLNACVGGKLRPQCLVAAARRQVHRSKADGGKGWAIRGRAPPPDGGMRWAMPNGCLVRLRNIATRRKRYRWQLTPPSSARHKACR